MGKQLNSQELPSSLQDNGFFRSLVEQSRELICLHDSEGSYLYVNPAAKPLLGLDPEELIGKSPFEFLPQEDGERVRREIKDSFRSGNPIEATQYRFIRKDGSEIWLETSMQPVRDRQGRITHIQTTSRDVTSQTVLHRSFEQEKKFSSLMSELAHVGAWESNIEEGTLFWSPAVFRILGRDPSLGIDRETVYRKYSHPEDMEKLRNFNMKAYQQGESYAVEHRMLDEEGNVIWVRSYGKPLHSEDRIVGVYGAMQDITFSKLVEEEIRLSEKKFSEAFHSSGNGIILVDKDGSLLEVNQSFAQMVGYTQEELLYKSFQEITYQEDLGIGGEALRKIVRGEKNNAQFAKRYIHKKGHIVWVFITAAAVRKDSGELMFIVTQVQDISRKRILENILREKNSRLKSVGSHLKERISQLEEFNQIVSHNIRSPIGNIHTLVRFLEEAETEEEKREYIDYLKKTSEQLLSTLNELVEVIRIRQSPKIVSERISFEESFSHVKSMFLGQITETGADVGFDFTLCPWINYPPVYLESIFLNLLSNSLKYRSQGRKPVIKFRTYWSGGIQVLEAEDNGLGIDLNKHGNQIFKLHKRFHRDTDGKGLGLFMTKNQIESLGGEINVESVPGSGTKFVIQLLRANEFSI
ncbi:PAS domain S-box protein [Leptospira wolffii]|uniref:PAS domain-containing sensor histidine kinase n=1 Tax=Leptospira wolffii TaxID=409998 RepID=UPI00108426A9|nr:PAS domain S-box protein [Leptospira wolffii]TGK61709.1 PAS domain S-box protein [Leptospira wolffii]TGK70252.1 PAS domain S-box protein [Leptospira wolffii]TGK77175.1 PAS domain S-box protein [Leptospira wolffii]TGL30972.1 PAS domain S-box protein [Leptospira wolffii]